MKAPPRDKRQQLILVAVVSLAVTAALWQFTVAAQQKRLATVTRRISEQQARLDNARRLVQTAAQIQQHLETALARLQAAEGEMAAGDMYSWVIQTVNKFREGYKVDIPQFSREVPCEVGLFARFPYKAVLFNLRGTAYFHDFGRFLADFENRFPFLRVQNLELEPAPASQTSSATDSEKLAFRMEIVALIRPQPL